MVFLIGAALLALTPARARIWEFLFLSEKVPEDAPTATGHAPFAAPPEGHAFPPEPTAPKNTVPLDKPHRASQDIREWLMVAVSEIMTLDSADIEQETEQEASSYFSQDGLNRYRAFLAESGLLKQLQTGRYAMRGFLKESPLLLNEGAVDGRYRWLYEVPVMVSFLPRGVNDYKNAVPQVQEITLTLQVGRVPATVSDIGVLIERWQGEVKK